MNLRLCSLTTAAVVVIAVSPPSLAANQCDPKLQSYTPIPRTFPAPLCAQTDDYFTGRCG